MDTRTLTLLAGYQTKAKPVQNRRSIANINLDIFQSTSITTPAVDSS